MADFGHWRHFGDWKDLTVEEVPRLSILAIQFWQLALFWITKSILDGQGCFKLQLKGISHWNLVSIAYQFQCLMAFHYMMLSELQTHFAVTSLCLTRGHTFEFANNSLAKLARRAV